MMVIASLAGACVVTAGLAVAFERKDSNRQARLGRFICRYADYEVARRIFRREIWLGQTENQLIDARGEPGRKYRMLATPYRETWYYRLRPFGRDRLQVTLENGIVIAWESTARHRFPGGRRFPFSRDVKTRAA